MAAVAVVAAHAGGGGGGGAARRPEAAAAAAAGAGEQQQADARTNNVRSTSVNNVNVDRNVNVNVDNNGCCNNGWDNDYHPVATAAAVTAHRGRDVRRHRLDGATVPPDCVPVNYGGMVYQQCGSTWYQPQGTQYIVVNPPY